MGPKAQAHTGRATEPHWTSPFRIDVATVHLVSQASRSEGMDCLGRLFDINPLSVASDS